MDTRPILIVDPDPDSLNIYSLVLQHHGFRVLRATDARKAWELSMREQPQLVLTELFLPQHEGQSFLELLKNDERTCNLPVVAITSLQLDDAGAKAAGVGYAGYLLKPCAPSRLLQEVRQVLSGTEAVQSMTAKA